jgi:hypothetical protein
VIWLLVAAVLVAGIGGAALWGASRIAAAIDRLRAEASATRSLQLLGVFAPGISAVEHDPRALLVWQPLALVARRLFPEEFAALDRAAGASFPFTEDQLQAAHARWTTDWLAWERTHDGEYKLKAAMLDEEIGDARASPAARARLDAVEREKLEKYQRRYEEYSRVSRAIKALMQP